MARRNRNEDGITIIYDGQCPFCASYVSMMRLRGAVGPVDLVDARGDDHQVSAVQNAGHDLDKGMVVLWQGEVFFGDGAVNLLATLSSDEGGVFNWIQRRVFSNPRRAAYLYPILASWRRFFLRLIGRQPIAGAPKRKIKSRG